MFTQHLTHPSRATHLPETNPVAEARLTATLLPPLFKLVSVRQVGVVWRRARRARLGCVHQSRGEGRMRILVAGMMVLGVTIAGAESGISVAGEKLPGIGSELAGWPAASANPASPANPLSSAAPARTPHPEPETLTNLVRHLLRRVPQRRPADREHHPAGLRGRERDRQRPGRRAHDHEAARRHDAAARHAPARRRTPCSRWWRRWSRTLDEAAARNPNPGSRTFQRLNRARVRGVRRGTAGPPDRRRPLPARSTPRAPTSTTSPTSRCSPRRSWTPT